MPLDAAKDALIALQGQLIAVLAARNAEVEARGPSFHLHVHPYPAMQGDPYADNRSRSHCDA